MQKSRRAKRNVLRICTIVIIATLLSGCGHAHWAAVRDKTQLASFMNPLGFAIHFTAVAGAMITTPENAEPIEKTESIDSEDQPLQ